MMVFGPAIGNPGDDFGLEPVGKRGVILCEAVVEK
jgi:hypothetical protein